MPSVITDSRVDETPSVARPATVEPSLFEENQIASSPISGLIDHHLSFPSTTTLREANRLFNESGHTYAAVLHNDLALGLCSREVVAFLLEGPQSIEQKGDQLVSSHILPYPLFIPKNTPITQMLQQAFARKGSEFLHHLIVIESPENKTFIGLIPLKNLVEIQSRLLKEQVDKLSRKEEMLRQTINQQFQTTVELRRAQNQDNNQKQMLRQTVQQQFRTTMELRRSQARYRILFENNGVGVALMNSEGLMTTCNRFLARLLKLPNDVLSEDTLFGNYLSPENRIEFTKTLQKLEAAGEMADPAHLEYAVHLVPEEESYFHLTLNFIAETSQHCLCVADVTEERRLQKHLLQKEKDVLLDSFVGGIAHELNNKVLPLLGYTELLMIESSGARDPEKILQYGNIIKKSSSDCTAIVRQLLELCKPASGRIVPCDLRAITKDALSFLLFRFREKEITIAERYDSSPIPIMADPNQIKQVIINLALNAIDSLEERDHKEIAFSVLNVNEMAVIEIQDSGTGISTQILPRIFDPFFTTKKAETARGLGLSVCRSIARQYQGEILVQSTLDVGSCFTVRVPLDRSVVDSVAPAQAVAVPVLKKQTTPRVLVVDDEDMVASLVGEVLKRKLQAQVDRAVNGQEGTEKIELQDYDLIISDVRMPVMNGAEFLKWIQANRPHLISKFFFMTGHEGSHTNSDEISRSGLPVLRKPFTIDALLAQCQKILGRSGS